MADLLMLKRGDEAETIDLLSGTYVLRDMSWMTGTPQPSSDYQPLPYGARPVFQNYGTQVETLDLIAQNATHSTIRAAERDIMEALDAARLYIQHPLWSVVGATSDTLPWFLHWNIDGETEKRSLIYEGSLAGINEQCAEPFISSDVSLLRMALIRHPFWEPISTDSNIVGTTSISAWGGTYDFTNVGGDVWARLYHTELYGKSGSGPITETWMGIREEMGGTANFEPIWDFGLATGSNGASTSTSRASYSGTGHIRKSSPAASLTLYAELSVNGVCTGAGHSDYIHQVGEYLVLGRVAADTGTVGLQMRYGYDLGTMKPCEEVILVGSDAWVLVELGNISIPPTGGEGYATERYAQYTEIQIYAEQIDGTSVLDIDGLCLIPTHHFWYAKGGVIGTNAGYAHVVTTTADDRNASYGWANYYPRYALEYSLKDWYLPTHNSIAVVAGQRAAVHNKDDLMGLQPIYYERWGMYRGLGGT